MWALIKLIKFLRFLNTIERKLSLHVREGKRPGVYRGYIIKQLPARHFKPRAEKWGEPYKTLTIL